MAPIGIPRSTFYDWYSRYQEGGIEALEDGKPRPRRIWNKIPDEIETAIVNLALEEPDLSPRELAVNFTDTQGSFVSEATVYRLLKNHGLITSPAFILMKAADRFANPTTAPNQLWQTDFTYLKVIGWGWFLPPDDARQDRAISSLDEKPDPAGQLLPARTARTEHRGDSLGTTTTVDTTRAWTS